MFPISSHINAIHYNTYKTQSMHILCLCIHIFKLVLFQIHKEMCCTSFLAPALTGGRSLVLHLEWKGGECSALFVCRCQCRKCPSAGCPGDPSQDREERRKRGRMMEFARSTSLPATGSYPVYSAPHPTNPSTYFFQVMFLTSRKTCI